MRSVVRFFFLMMGRPPRSTLFPSTTLFRSRERERVVERPVHVRLPVVEGLVQERVPAPGDLPSLGERVAESSEEHTSELPSRQYLVCRLLLDKNLSGCRKASLIRTSRPARL